jgi:hypothetical protein
MLSTVSSGLAAIRLWRLISSIPLPTISGSKKANDRRKASSLSCGSESVVKNWTGRPARAA